MQFYNTLTREKTKFVPIHPGKVGLYRCGPTVYDYAHIGNLRTYIFEDILKRALEYDGFEVRHVMNLTDVGHLASDADEGMDKMEKGAAREGKSAWVIAEEYTKAFFDDCRRLNIQMPTVVCKATDHIKEQIELIRTLERKGYTYRTSDGIYFDSSKFEEYGKMAKLNKEGLEAGKRVEFKEKRNATDFALWKFSPKDQKRQMEWDSPWGMGFPGWHIECSAMGMKYLGNHFDIHCGGVDHIPIHHTNEIAQSEAATGEKFVNYWLHGEFLITENEKMSKSKGEFLTLNRVIEKGFDPIEYRYFCLGTNYRKSLVFSWERLEVAREDFSRLKKEVLAIRNEASQGTGQRKKGAEEYDKRFLESIEDDLNVHEALRVLHELIGDPDVSPKDKYASILKYDRVFGLGLESLKETHVPPEVRRLAEEREIARKNKEWKLSDELRKKVDGMGFRIEDTKEGYEIIAK